MKAYGSDPACLDKKNDENLFGLPRETVQPFCMVPFLKWCCKGEPPVMKVALFLLEFWPFLLEKFLGHFRQTFSRPSSSGQRVYDGLLCLEDA